MSPKKKAASKGILSSLVGLIIGLVVIGIVLVVGFTVMVTMQGTLTAGTAAYNSTVTTISAMGQIPTWLPIIIIAAIGSVVIGIVFLYTGGMKKGRA